MISGIDLSQSGWENPDHHKREPRQPVKVAPVQMCAVPGPDGWVCDLAPHAGNRHGADTGHGPRLVWESGDLIPPRAVPLATLMAEDGVRASEHAAGQRLRAIEALTIAAMDSQRPADWATALDRVRTLASGEIDEND